MQIENQKDNRYVGLLYKKIEILEKENKNKSKKMKIFFLIFFFILSGVYLYYTSSKKETVKTVEKVVEKVVIIEKEKNEHNYDNKLIVEKSKYNKINKIIDDNIKKEKPVKNEEMKNARALKIDKDVTNKKNLSNSITEMAESVEKIQQFSIKFLIMMVFYICFVFVMAKVYHYAKEQ